MKEKPFPLSVKSPNLNNIIFFHTVLFLIVGISFFVGVTMFAECLVGWQLTLFHITFIDKLTHAYTHTPTDRERQTDRERETDRQRERDRHILVFCSRGRIHVILTNESSEKIDTLSLNQSFNRWISCNIQTMICVLT